MRVQTIGRRSSESPGPDLTLIRQILVCLDDRQLFTLNRNALPPKGRTVYTWSPSIERGKHNAFSCQTMLGATLGLVPTM